MGKVLLKGPLSQVQEESEGPAASRSRVHNVLVELDKEQLQQTKRQSSQPIRHSHCQPAHSMLPCKARCAFLLAQLPHASLFFTALNEYLIWYTVY